MRVLLVCLWVLILGGCASRQHYQLQDLPLPAAAEQGCCWQAAQQLEIHYRQDVYRLSAALARTAQGASLVLLDPMGRRLFSIRQQGGQLETYRAPELPQDLPERFLLASSMLVWWPLADWQHLQGSDWSLVAGVDTRELLYRGQPVLTATFSPAPDSVSRGIGSATLVNKEVALLQHHKIPLSIRVTTTQWGAL